MGRPSVYSNELADAICEAIATGEHSGALHLICQRRDDFPTERTVYSWLQNNEAFLHKYQAARARQQDHEIDECIRIADEATDPNKARVQILARQWRAGKLAPKKYGERVEHAGEIEHKFVARLPEPTSSMDEWKDRYLSGPKESQASREIVAEPIDSSVESDGETTAE